MNRPNDRNAVITIGEVRDFVAMAMWEGGFPEAKLITSAPVTAPYDDAIHGRGVYIGGGEPEKAQRAFYRALNLARMTLKLPLVTITCEDCFVFNRKLCTHILVVDATPIRPNTDKGFDDGFDDEDDD